MRDHRVGGSDLEIRIIMSIQSESKVSNQRKSAGEENHVRGKQLGPERSRRDYLHKFLNVR